MLNILGVFMMRILWLKCLVDFCKYLYVIDDVYSVDMKCFILRIVFLVVFFLDLVLLMSIILILFLMII